MCLISWSLLAGTGITIVKEMQFTAKELSKKIHVHNNADGQKPVKGLEATSRSSPRKTRSLV